MENIKKIVGIEAAKFVKDGMIVGLGTGSTAAFFVVFWMISYVLELYNLSTQNRVRVLLMFGLNLFYAVISLGKTNFLTFLLSSLSI